MKRVLIYIDQDAIEESLDLLEAAEQMYGADFYTAYGLFVGSACSRAEGIVDHLLVIDAEKMSSYDVQNITACIDELHGSYRFNAVLFPATLFGRMIAPRAAVRLRAGLVAEVTEVHHRGNDILLVRPAFSGRMLAGIITKGDGPVMMTVRNNTFTRRKRVRKDTEIHVVHPSCSSPPGVRLIEHRRKEAVQDIRESDVLVAGGGGVMRHIEQLEDLARELNGMTAASRRVVDSGRAPRHIQVGQSGKTVSPKLYIAIGISGSIQHAVGLKNAECIISVNSDPYAPICALADIVVIGDGMEFIQGLLKKIREHRTASSENGFPEAKEYRGNLPGNGGR